MHEEDTRQPVFPDTGEVHADCVSQFEDDGNPARCRKEPGLGNKIKVDNTIIVVRVQGFPHRLAIKPGGSEHLVET